MIQIGRYRLSHATLSIMVVFLVLSACAITAAFHQARPEYPMPLYQILLINEGMALIATLIYGMFLHLVTAIINKFK